MSNFRVDLTCRVGGIELKNPVLVAAGTFGFGEEYFPLVKVNKLGGIITKTLTLKPCSGNPPPRLVETPAGLLNSIGLENPGVDTFVQEKLPFLKKLNTCVIVSIGGGKEEEYLMLAEKLANKEGINALEVNVSCPNVKLEGYLPGKNAKLIFSLTRKLKEVTDLPLIIKLAPDVTDIVEIARACLEGGAEALSLINTFPGMAIDVNTWRPKLGNITGGLSGPAIKPVAVRAVWEVYHRLNVPIIGMGGIMSFEDALEFVLAGASAIAVGTANFVNPQIPLQIVNQLEDYLIEKKIERFSWLTGKVKVTKIR